MSQPAMGSFKDAEGIRGLLRNLRAGIYVCNVRGEFLYASDEFLEILGIDSLRELKNLNARDLLKLEDLPNLQKKSSILESQLVVRSPIERPFIALNVMSSSEIPTSKEAVIQGMLIDISHRTSTLPPAAVDSELRDFLTGSFSRHYVKEFEDNELQKGGKWGCVYVYVDHFKQYADKYGYYAGEDALRQMVRFLMRHVRAGDAIVRLHESDFLMLFSEIDLATLTRVAKRIRNAALGQAPVPFSMGFAVRKGKESLNQTILEANYQMNPVQVLTRKPRLRARTGH